jgi:hypothetical protein
MAKRGGFAFGWICGFVVMLIARAALDAPLVVVALLGLIGYWVIAPGLLLLGMKVSEFFIRRSPGGAALIEEHKTEQAVAWKELEAIDRREAAGERVDPAEKSRVEGILFRNEGVLGGRTARPAAGGPVSPGGARGTREVVPADHDAIERQRAADAVEERMAAMVANVTAEDEERAGNELLSDLLKLRKRDFSVEKHLTVADCKLVYWGCADSLPFPPVPWNEMTEDQQAFRVAACSAARDIASRWTDARGIVVDDTDVWETLELTPGEREELAKANASLREMAAKQIAFVYADAQEAERRTRAGAAARAAERAAKRSGGKGTA